VGLWAKVQLPGEPQNLTRNFTVGAPALLIDPANVRDSGCFLFNVTVDSKAKVQSRVERLTGLK